ncbi:uncharacterized protein [Aegilops tauschii subsp. strangulata]|uniref:uncharacterized protein n=1 Tax=Aegilops tauschii subsp. strangulata TaxID=200361 RepID=UPI003CC8A545
MGLCSSNWKDPVHEMTTTGVATIFRRGTYAHGKDPCIDPFCVWGNDILMNKHQVRKLIRIISKKIRMVARKLFVYALYNTTVSCRMWFPKQFTQDYLAKYMIGGHALKVKVFHPDYNEHREVVM